MYMRNTRDDKPIDNSISPTVAAFLNVVPQVCALMVIVLHQYNITGISNAVGIHFVSLISHGLCTAAVPTFFLISGFLFWRTVSCFQDIVIKQKKRIKSVLVPFLCWNTLYFLIYSGGGRMELTVENLLSGVFLYSCFFPMWYMFQLLVFILLSPCIYVLLKDERVQALVLLSLCIASVFGMGSIDFHYNGLERSLLKFNFLLYYMFGAILSRHTSWIEHVVSRLPSPFVLVGVYVMVSIGSSFIMDGYISCAYHRLLVPLVFVAFVMLMLKISAEFPADRNLILGVSPMGIYGMQGVSGMLLGALFNMVGWSNSLDRYIFFSIAAILLTIALSYGLKRIIPTLYAILVGYR